MLTCLSIINCFRCAWYDRRLQFIRGFSFRVIHLETVGVGAAADEVVVRKLVDGANGSEGVVLVVHEAADDVLDLNDVNRIDTSHGLDGVHAAAERDHLATNVLASRGRAIELGKHGKLGLVLGLIELLRAEVVAHLDEELRDVVHELVELHSVGDKVHAEQASVTVESVEGSQGLSEVLTSDLAGNGGGEVLATHGVDVEAVNEILEHHE